ncbi:MAG: hypothetical protein ACTSYX_01870 [Candidatus Thorarchaeota archaeon]
MSHSDSLIVRRTITPVSILLRLIAGLYCVWCYLLIPVIPYLRWDPTQGVYWVNGAPGSLFPLPRGPGMTPVIVPATPVDSVIYMTLIMTGGWLVLLALALLYILSPVTIAIRR